MILSDLNTGEKAVIVRVNGHGSFRKRLIEMGFINGKEVRVVLNAPLKDPIEYEIIGYKVSLRREEARQIEVVTEEEARANCTAAKRFSSAVPKKLPCGTHSDYGTIMILPGYYPDITRIFPGHFPCLPPIPLFA